MTRLKDGSKTRLEDKTEGQAVISEPLGLGGGVLSHVSFFSKPKDKTEGTTEDKPKDKLAKLAKVSKLAIFQSFQSFERLQSFPT